MQIKVKHIMTTRGSYVHKPVVEFSGGIPKLLVYAIFS